MQATKDHGLRLNLPGKLEGLSRHETATAAGPAEPRMATRHLTQVDVARRWRMSERTLERWRWLRQGPPYLKIGGRVVYRVEDIERFEMSRAHPARETTAGPAAARA